MRIEIKTVLEIDLVSYSDIARTLEENLSVYAVKAFQEQIQAFIDYGLSAHGLHRNDVVFGTAGDSAILVFDKAALMHHFAERVSVATREHNEKKSIASAKRWFRMGCATGSVLLNRSKKKIIGDTVARAVRLERASYEGKLLVDVATFEALPKELQDRYGPELVVKGKRDESFVARSCVLVEMNDQIEGKLPVPTRNPLLEVWEYLDPDLQDAFSLAYNKKRQEIAAHGPTRISTRDLFRALAHVNDEELRRLLSTLPTEALPEPSDMNVTNEPRLLIDHVDVSDTIAESLRGFSQRLDPKRKITPTDIFVDISKYGDGPSVSQLRQHGIGPAEIDEKIASLGIKLSHRTAS